MGCARIPGQTRQMFSDALEAFGREVHGGTPEEEWYRIRAERQRRSGLDHEIPTLTGAIMCGLGVVPCLRCGCLSEYLCDQPLGGSRTCDAPLCPDCATEIGEDLHLCPVHAKDRRF